MEFRFWPSAMQRPSSGHRTDYIIPSLDDCSGDMSNPMNLIQKLSLACEESSIHKVVAFGSGESETVFSILSLFYELRPWNQETGALFPSCPCNSRCGAY